MPKRATRGKVRFGVEGRSYGVVIVATCEGGVCGRMVIFKPAGFGEASLGELSVTACGSSHGTLRVGHALIERGERARKAMRR